MNQAAIVTLAVGEPHLAYWRKYCERSWNEYAQKCGYDLIVVTEPLDRSARAAGRSPAWQKCLVLSQEFSAKYRQVISLDCDVAINAQAAPPITDRLPLERVSGVISGSHIHEDLLPVLVQRMFGQGDPHERGAGRWQEMQRVPYARYGLNSLDRVVQTGVLVASPTHHRAVFESVYLADYSYTSRCYEQIPLSHTLLTKGLIEPIDTRFNSVFHESMRVHYPYLLNKQLPAYDLLASCAVQTQFANNFFLHFAYDRDFARYLPPQVIAQ